MGCGNCCVFGRYEGLYYIDNDDFHVFRRADAASDDCPEPRLMRILDYEELTDGTWLYDDLATELEEEDHSGVLYGELSADVPQFQASPPGAVDLPQPAGHLGEPTFLYLP